MNIEDIKKIKEIADIQRITVNPGQESEVIYWDKGFLIVTAVQGDGLLRNADDEDIVRSLSCEAVIKIASSNDNKFKLAVPKDKKKPLVAIIIKMLSTKKHT